MIPPEHHHPLLRALLERGEIATIRCAGRSMEPTVRLGEEVRVRACRRPRVGEVVLFETGARDALILHRVMWAAPGAPWFLHLGDAGSPIGPRFARVDRIVGRAELPRRLPGPRDWVAVLRALARGARRALRGATKAA